MRALDYALVPAFLLGAVIATAALEALNATATLISIAVVGGAAVIAAVVERLRPEREDYRRLDQPLLTDTLHFLFNYNLGFIVASAIAGVVAGSIRATPMAIWPAGWPTAAQVLAAMVLAEGVSYWQHRLFHRLPWLWPFHALHHSGSKLNLIRGVRFHFVDSVTAASMVFLPLALLGAPERVFVWTIVIGGVLGVLQHANMRMRVPGWLDRVICTPAVHRLHHSSDPREGNANFGVTVMLFDLLFGSYIAPDAPGPKRVGIENDPVPSGFFKQTFGPFRR